MAILLVQAKQGVSSAAFTSANTVHNFLVAEVGLFVYGKISVTDSQGNTWKRANGACGRNCQNFLFANEIWYAEDCKAGANTVSVNNVLGTPSPDIVVREFSGVALSASLDQSAYATYVLGGNSTSAAVGPVTTLFANELLISFFANCTTNGLTLTAGSGYTLDFTSNGNYGYEYKILSAAPGSVSGGGTYSGTGSSVPWAAAIATFKPAQAAPVISSLAFSKTDTTIVATWTTDLLTDSNMTAGGKAAIDNGLQTQVTSHQAIVTGLTPSTLYSCVVISGGVSSTPQNVTTNAAQSRTAILSAANSAPTNSGTHGDTIYNFISNDNVEYNVMNDGNGWQNPIGSFIHAQIDSLSNESTLTGSVVNVFSNQPTGTPIYSSGLFGMGGVLYNFLTSYTASNPQVQIYGYIAQSPDHGVTWNSWYSPSTFSANGVYAPSANHTGQYDGNNNFGWTTPVRYAKDDGTLGYLTAGNGIDGADGFVYIMLLDTFEQDNSNIYLARVPRALLTYITNTFQYWKGPIPSLVTPADFVNDANWQSGAINTTGLTPIYTAASQVSAPDMVFIPVINRYLLLTFYYPDPTVTVTSNTVWVISEAPTPAGPWTQVYTQTNNPTGYYSEYVLHRTAAENTLANSIPLSLTYTTDYGIQPYNINHSILTLTTDIHAISGSAGVAGATVSYAGPTSGSVTADGSGNYSIPDLADGDYIVTPSKTGYTFSPTSASETVSGADITGVNFTATQLQVATPTFSPVAGTYSSAQSVTVSDTDSGLGGFAMYYTTDGSTPTTGSTLYTGAITVSASETIKVLAVATGYINSVVASGTYVIGGSGGDGFNFDFRFRY